MDYWEECVRTAFDDAGIVATEEQVQSVRETVEGAYLTYCDYHGHAVIGNPLLDEIKELKQQLKNEKAKKTCLICKGEGELVIFFGFDWESISACETCNGEGKV